MTRFASVHSLCAFAMGVSLNQSAESWDPEHHALGMQWD